jgi:hypothetical protein
MQVLEFFENLVEQWNEEQKCGFCWNFYAAGRSDYSNIIQFTDDNKCCVNVILLAFGSKLIKKQNYDGLISEEYCAKYFELLVGIPSSLDIQFYNENPDIDKSESKYSLYIKPLLDCLGCGIDIECNESGFDLLEWSNELVLNYQDYNIDGLRIKGSFKDIN